MKRQQGFTIIELIVVIVVLGILAATAIPRFANIGTEARIASMQGVAGSMNSAREIIRARWYAIGSNTVATVTTVDGTVVAVTSGTGATAGMPTAAGMVNAVSVSGNISCAAAGAVTTCNPTGFATCTVTYTDTTGVVSTAGAVTANCGG